MEYNVAMKKNTVQFFNTSIFCLFGVFGYSQTVKIAGRLTIRYADITGDSL